ncbi:hypothetical protein BGZ47_002503 [Haplosporangium gracile]|nr:hypothetical protein BGZ47_002503 [Haplosporangium gracile]
MVLPRLRKLQIQHGGIVEYDQAIAFWKVCSRLESLKLRQTYFSPLTGTNYPYPDLSNMKELFLSCLGMEFERQARIVAQCGQLRRLWWSTLQESKARNNAIPLFEDAILSRRRFGLEAVRIELRPRNFAGSLFSSWLKQVECTLYPGKPWSSKTLFTIRDYFPRLTELSIDDLTDKGRRLSLLLLMSCPNLRTVTAPLLKVSEMMELTPRGWACARLRRLSVYFEVDRVSGIHDDENGEECNRFILQHLSALTELEVLLLNGPHKNYDVRQQRDSFKGNLKVCLASGLGILAGLRYLRGVSLPGHQPWTRAELDWAKEHWTRLTDLAGINKYNKCAEKGLENELNTRVTLKSSPTCKATSSHRLIPFASCLNLLISLGPSWTRSTWRHLFELVAFGTTCLVCRLWKTRFTPYIVRTVSDRSRPWFDTSRHQNRAKWETIVTAADTKNAVRATFIQEHKDYVRHLTLYDRWLLISTGAHEAFIEFRMISPGVITAEVEAFVMSALLGLHKLQYLQLGGTGLDEIVLQRLLTHFPWIISFVYTGKAAGLSELPPGFCTTLQHITIFAFLATKDAHRVLRAFPALQTFELPYFTLSRNKILEPSPEETVTRPLVERLSSSNVASLTLLKLYFLKIRKFITLNNFTNFIALLNILRMLPGLELHVLNIYSAPEHSSNNSTAAVDQEDVQLRSINIQNHP